MKFPSVTSILRSTFSTTRQEIRTLKVFTGRYIPLTFIILAVDRHIRFWRFLYFYLRKDIIVSGLILRSLLRGRNVFFFCARLNKMLIDCFISAAPNLYSIHHSLGNSFKEFPQQKRNTVDFHNEDSSIRFFIKGGWSCCI